MEEILALGIQFVLEAIINLFGVVPGDLTSRNRTKPEREVIWPANLLWLCAGGALGWLSTLVFTTTLLPSFELRLGYMLAAPLVAGGLSGLIASRRARSNPTVVPRNHFWLAFWFTVGFAVIRFAYAGRA